MKATLSPIFMEVLLKNQPEGVQLCVKEVKKLTLIYAEVCLYFYVGLGILICINMVCFMSSCIFMCLQHTEADFQSRFKARPELEGLIAKISN